MSVLRWVLAAILLIAAPLPALAHSSTRGFVLLLPTGYVIFSGALVVLVSFIVVSTLKSSSSSLRLRPAAQRHSNAVLPSVISAIILGVAVSIGFTGPHDPAENLLPLMIWTLWWVIIVLLHPLFGDLWQTLNPFSGPARLIARIFPPPLAFPVQLAYWPALLIYAAFAWFQLVYPGPENPPRLALVVMLYVAGTMLAIMAFGHKTWLGKADPFAVFLSQVGATAPRTGAGWTYPGAGLLSLAPLPAAGMLFVLLTLSSISFDGLANTFAWLAVIGINPLDYPGRTAVMLPNTLGLLGSFILLAAVYVSAVCAGWAWAGKPVALGHLLGRLVLSLIPISIAYHLAHYLGDALLNLQYTVLALNDPLGSGENLLGLAGMHVTASFQNTAFGALVLFSVQTVSVVLGHVVATVVAHAMAADTGLDRVTMMKLEAPLAALMVLYTTFGLWLLATPAIS